MRFTIFTPTYNRANTLPRVYESLKKQTVRDFEWLIVDDGSTDNTRELVRAWQSECTEFDIRYIYQENQHKKVAHNRAVSEARGELFIVLDSDDSCVPEALEKFWEVWHSIPNNRRAAFAGVCCLCQYENGAVVGDKFPCSSHIDSDSLEIRFRHKVWGEKWGCNRTGVLKEYPFREDIPGLVGESSVWDAIARCYKIRYFNKALRVYHQDVAGLIPRSGETRNFKVNAPGQVYARKLFLDNHFNYFSYSPLHYLKVASLFNVYFLYCAPDLRRYLGYWPSSWRARLLVAITSPVGLGFWIMTSINQRLVK